MNTKQILSAAVCAGVLGFLVSCVRADAPPIVPEKKVQSFMETPVVPGVATPPPIVKPELAPTTTTDSVGAPPEEMVFETDKGDVFFYHKKHSEREGQCAVCHDEIFPQDKSEPLNFNPGGHRAATKNRTSCASCHAPEGKAFQVKGNCRKCHE